MECMSLVCGKDSLGVLHRKMKITLLSMWLLLICLKGKCHNCIYQFMLLKVLTAQLLKGKS